MNELNPTRRDRISVVIPTRNRRHLLERLLGQLLRPEVADHYEVIVIDEASTDSTPELLESLAEAGKVRFIRNDPPLRLPGARNCGLEHATGHYVAWIDDDDLTSPDRLVRQRAAIDATDNRWSCAAKVDIDDELTVTGFRRCPPTGDFLRTILRFNCLPAAAQGILVETSLARHVGGFDTSLRAAEDWDFCIRLAEIATPHMLDEPLVGYRVGFESMSTDTALMEATIGEVYDKHAQLMRRLDVEPDWHAVHQSLLAADLLNGRLAAFRRSLRVAANAPSIRSLARAMIVGLAPHRFARISAQRRIDQVPDAWRTSARVWLDDVDTSPQLTVAPPDL